ncbi:prephenate dehydrogenase [Solicola sp. PLA-1-18]|uniref:prephenate dehydrogenase n=1 Tax=Solicola sp. PLA-1-18 TaxID=3380532 RepID=UPI003B7D2C99
MSRATVLRGPVLVVGCGLLGTSVGLALTQAGVAVHLSDLSDDNAATAAALGAGTTDAPSEVELVVVAVPPDAVGDVVVGALADWPDAVVTDVASVKAAPLRRADASGVDLSRYVGGHPMAGSERSGPGAGTADLFRGRVWAVTPHPASRHRATETVFELAVTCGASAVLMDPVDHDAAVARVSHLPHLLSVVTAAQLGDAPAEHLALAGQGLRDVTRIAESDPALWTQIVRGNAEPIAALLTSVRDDIDRLIDGLSSPDDALSQVLARGVAGTSRLPGKHGAPERVDATVYVRVPDRPGELARLFVDAEESGVNIEDLRIDHDVARPVGVVEVGVRPDSADVLVASLSAKGWSAHR